MRVCKLQAIVFVIILLVFSESIIYFLSYQDSIKAVQFIGVLSIAVLVSLYAGIRLFGVWGIIKGPLGFVLIYETYHSLSKMSDRQKNGEDRS